MLRNLSFIRITESFGTTARMVVLTLLLTAIAQGLGVWSLLDAPCYDFLLRARAQWTEYPDRVLLVHTTDAGWRVSRLDSLVAQMAKLGAASVSLLPTTPAQFQELETGMAELANRLPGRLYIGVPTARASDNPHATVLACAWSSQLPRAQQAPLALPSADHGVLRQQSRALILSGAIEPLLETRVSGARYDRPEEYGIDFRGGSGSLPHLSAEQVEAGRIISDLVQGRHILIGASPDPNYLGLATPMTQGDYRISALEFHGHALNTLLNRTEIVAISGLVQWLHIVTCTLIAAWVSQQMPQRIAYGMLLILSLGSVTLSAFGLALFHRWLPVACACGALGIANVLVVDRRLAMLNQIVRKMDFELVNRARRRRQPSNLILATDPWSILGSWVQQIVPIKQLAFFESRNFDMYLRGVYTWGCSSHEIVERRRDSRRHPFSTASESGTAYRLPLDRPMFPGPASQPQYLVPLVYRGQAYGFMAMSMAATTQEEARLEMLHQVGRELARLVSQWQFHAASRRPHWSDWLGTQSEEQSLVGLMHSTHRLEDRLLRLENIMDTTTSGIAVFDGFGRLLTINHKLSDALQSEGMVGEPRQLDVLVSQLAGQPLTFVQEQIRTLLQSGLPQTLYVELRHSRTSWILTLRVVAGLETTSEWHETADMVSLPASDALPFRCHAIVLELTSRDTVDVIQWLTDSLQGELVDAR